MKCKCAALRIGRGIRFGCQATLFPDERHDIPDGRVAGQHFLRKVGQAGYGFLQGKKQLRGHQRIHAEVIEQGHVQ